jgi:ferredoxin
MLITGFIMMVLFTAVYGRIWCGWLCPQTVLMEMVFRKIEYAIEGDAHTSSASCSTPHGPRARFSRKPSNTSSSSPCPSSSAMAAHVHHRQRTWIKLVTDNPRNHLKGLTAMIGLRCCSTASSPGSANRPARSSAPTAVFNPCCSTTTPSWSPTTTSAASPAALSPSCTPYEERRAEGIGDCVDCRLCVQVCPTGIDIRNGTQMECVNCTACIDACDSVMDKVGFAPRTDSLCLRKQRHPAGEKINITPRISSFTPWCCAS